MKLIDSYATRVVLDTNPNFVFNPTRDVYGFNKYPYLILVTSNTTKTNNIGFLDNHAEAIAHKTYNDLKKKWPNLQSPDNLRWFFDKGYHFKPHVAEKNFSDCNGRFGTDVRTWKRFDRNIFYPLMLNLEAPPIQRD